MSATDENAYILGTDQDELHRLGIQHQVWSSEALKGWNAAGFKNGDIILDLGCGPGYCSQELAYITGAEGQVIGVDRSQGYIRFLQELSDLHGLGIEAICTDFKDLEVSSESLDGMFCRWALAWTPEPEQVLMKVHDALRSGGRMVIQEYYDWSTHQTTPEKATLRKAIAMALKSFKDSESEIDIGRELTALLHKLGMKVISYRPMQKLVEPAGFEWQWPKSFYASYFPRLVDMGYLSSNEVEQSFNEIRELEKTKGSFILCPTMIEIIAEKR